MEFPVFQFARTAFLPFTGHRCEESGSIFSTPSHQVFIHFDKVPPSLLFSRRNSPSCHNLQLAFQALSPTSHIIDGVQQYCPPFIDPWDTPFVIGFQLGFVITAPGDQHLSQVSVYLAVHFSCPHFISFSTHSQEQRMQVKIADKMFILSVHKFSGMQRCWHI